MKLTPKVKKENLLLVAAFVWFTAGTMLIYRGVIVDEQHSISIVNKLLIGISLGVLLYLGMFRRIVKKHTERILALPDEKLNIFLFFNRRSYILMFTMITLGVALRLSGIVPLYLLSTFYIVMGVPLLLSACKFLDSWINEKR